MLLTTVDEPYTPPKNPVILTKLNVQPEEQRHGLGHMSKIGYNKMVDIPAIQWLIFQ